MSGTGSSTEDTYSIVTRVIEPGKTMCGLCSRLRRGILYRVADELGATKIALGHHRDDIVETLFLNMFFGARLKAMPPKLKSDDGKHIVIRPLAYCAERDIARYARGREFPIIPCNLCGSQDNMKRRDIKAMLAGWEQQDPGPHRPAVPQPAERHAVASRRSRAVRFRKPGGRRGLARERRHQLRRCGRVGGRRNLLQCLERLARAAEPLLRFLREQLVRAAVDRQRASPASTGNGGVAVLVEDLLGRRADVGLLARQHLIQDDAERVQDPCARRSSRRAACSGLM